jgi:hypothetical protein
MGVLARRWPASPCGSDGRITPTQPSPIKGEGAGNENP